jgi:vacuolar protein sorting-associated protein 45
MQKRSASSTLMGDGDLDGIAAIRGYIDRVVNGDGKCSGMKVLLLDASTTQIVSCVYSQTEILSNEVYLVARLDDQSNPNKGNNSKQSHLKAVCFIRPTEVTVGLLVHELSKPRFAEYHFFFSGIVTTGLLRLLAEQDVHERVRQVQEFYGDFVPINEDLLTMQCRNTLAMTVAAGTSWAPQHSHLYERNLKGLQGMMLALKRQPSMIRYAGHSKCAEEVAKDIHDAISTDEIFHFRARRGSTGMLLLVLDRRDDPVTPLLSQWTYQAMVHELLGLNNHRVILKGAPNVPKDLEEVVLSSSQDEFFKANRHKNFGELGEQIQHLLQEYQKHTAQHNTGNLNTLEDMQAFMEKFPELKSRSHTVSKHVAIMGELARLVDVCCLMDVSQFEQELACSEDHHAHWKELMEKLASPHIQIPDKLRLGLLYALRYEISGNLHMVQQAMKKGGVPADMVNLVNVMLRFAGTKSRGPGLYGDNHNLMTKMTKSFITSVQGVSNVYSQHVPLLMDIVQSAARGKLRTDTHPLVPGSYYSSRGVSPNNSSHGMNGSNQTGPETIIPQEIMVFMVGGVTYEEGTKIAEFNEQNKGKIQVILGGSTVHNSTSFLEELKNTAL